MNIGLQIVIQIILGVIGINLIKKFPSGITKDANNNENNQLGGYDTLRLEAKNSKMTDNNHHLDNPNAVDDNQAHKMVGRKGIFTPLKTLGKNVSNSGTGTAAKMMDGKGGLTARAVLFGLKAKNEIESTTGVPVGLPGSGIISRAIVGQKGKKQGNSIAIKGFARPLVGGVRYKATKKQIERQENKGNKTDSNAIADNTKRTIKYAINSDKKYTDKVTKTEKGHVSPANDRNTGDTDSPYHSGVNEQDIIDATNALEEAVYRIIAIAEVIKVRRGDEFKITGVSNDPLINNYTGEKGQIEDVQNTVRNSVRTHYHNDTNQQLKEILADMEKHQQEGNEDLSNQLKRIESATKYFAEEATKYFHAILQDMFINEGSDDNKKIKARAQDFTDRYLSNVIRESSQMNNNPAKAREEIGINQPGAESRGIHYAESTEKVLPSEGRTNSINTTATDRQSYSNTTIVANETPSHTPQVALDEKENISGNETSVTYSQSEQKITTETKLQPKKEERRTTTAEAEVQAQRIVNNRSTESNVETTDSNTNSSTSESQIDEQGPFLENSSSRGQRKRRKPSTRAIDTEDSSINRRQVIGRHVRRPIGTYTDNDGVEHPQFGEYYDNEGTGNPSNRKNDWSA